MDRTVAWRAALLQLLLVAAVAVPLGALVDDAFFEDWGWLAGPGVWAACALVVAAALRLPVLPVLAGALVSGLPSLAAVLAGVHWAGTPLALILFGLWCGWVAGRRDRSSAGGYSASAGYDSSAPAGDPAAFPRGGAAPAERRSGAAQSRAGG